MMQALTKIRYTFELVKFSHTVFALPFALAAYFVATQGRLEPQTLGWVLACLILARTSAMACNRLADAKFDAKNPRTRNRHLPAGLLSPHYVWALTILSGLGFILAAGQLNRLAFYLSPICLALLFLYSFTKRFTHWTQFFLGLSLGMAPMGAQIAVTGHLSIPSLILGLGVLFWVAGFDLLYALQDLDFDKEQGLHSLTIRIGEKNTFRMAKALHISFLLALLVYGILLNFGLIYWTGLTLSGAFLFWEHWTLREDLKNLEAAFFTANGLLSIFFFLFVVAQLIFSR